MFTTSPFITVNSIPVIDKKINQQSTIERKGKFYSSQIEDYNRGTASQKALRTVPPIRGQSSFFETESCTLNAIDRLHNSDLQVQSGGSL